MQCGKLRHRIIIQNLVSTLSPEGESVKTWQTFATRWADIRTVSAKEIYKHDTNKVLISHTILIHYLANLDETMRISWNGRIFNITGFHPDPTNRKRVIIACTEAK